MRITYRTLGRLINEMNADQLDSDLTVEIPGEFGSECFCAELRVAGEEHDGGLDDGHPVIYANLDGEHKRHEPTAEELGL